VLFGENDNYALNAQIMLILSYRASIVDIAYSVFEYDK